MYGPRNLCLDLAETLISICTRTGFSTLNDDLAFFYFLMIRTPQPLFINVALIFKISSWFITIPEPFKALSRHLHIPLLSVPISLTL